jgi:aldehyde dehydrogenase (NAD+)
MHASVLDEYCTRIGALLGRTPVGDPRDPATGMGPLIRPAARDRVESYIAGAVDAGARIVCGATRPEGLDRGLDSGWFYLPTILAGVDNTWPVAREEIFGPVGVVIGFDTDDEAVALANDTPYGLAGHVVSHDTGRAFEIACRLRTGSVDLNGGPGHTNPDVPFGGVKRSGLGRENGVEGFGEYVQTKTIKYGAR